MVEQIFTEILKPIGPFLFVKRNILQMVAVRRFEICYVRYYTFIELKFGYFEKILHVKSHVSVLRQI